MAFWKVHDYTANLLATILHPGTCQYLVITAELSPYPAPSRSKPARKHGN